MKKVILVGIITFLHQMGFSQMTMQDIKKGNYGTPEIRAQQADDMMQKGLQLTPQQIPLLKEINLRYAWRVENEVVKIKMSDWSRYNKISSIQKEKDKELKSILSKKQLEKYKKKQDEVFWAVVKSYFF
jgi:DNA-directed RNA polymerase subunit F